MASIRSITPCLRLFTTHGLPLSTSLRHSSSSSTTTSPFASSPSPPRLPKDEQEIFEELQRKSTGAFSTPRSDDSSATTSTMKEKGGEQLLHHPNLRRGAPPEFEGDTNPKTGEVGGPKNEPLRWGSGSDYSYNGRVTDF